jgi:hypothetical protein
MTIFIDAPNWPGHDLYWSHLISDESFAELSEFADMLGIPRRAFDGDHYDIPAERFEECLAAGAIRCSSHDLVGKLTAAGLRRRKRSRLAP